MSIYPIPNWTEELTTFNTINYPQSVESTGFTLSYLDANYLKYPVAQGDETFTNTSNTGDATVQGTLKTNTIEGTTTTSSVLLYPLLTSTNLSIGAGLTSGTLKIGTATNSNHIGLLDFTGATLNHVNPDTGGIFICNDQTTALLSLGGGTSRTGAINIGTGASATCAINFGGTSTTTNLNGTPKFGNVPLIPTAISIATSSTIADNYPQNLLVNMTLATQTITMPVTPYTGQKINFINGTVGTSFLQSVTYPFIGYGLATSTPLFVYSGQTVICQFNGSNWIVLFKSNETYAPVYSTYSTVPAYSGFSQIGYVYSGSLSPTATTTTGVKTFSTANLGSTLSIPLGIYLITVRALLTTTTASAYSNFIVSYSSTSLSTTTYLDQLYSKLVPIQANYTTGTFQSNYVSGIYQRTSTAQANYATVEYQCNTAGTLTPVLYYNITRIA